MTLSISVCLTILSVVTFVCSEAGKLFHESISKPTTEKTSLDIAWHIISQSDTDHLIVLDNQFTPTGQKGYMRNSTKYKMTWWGCNGMFNPDRAYSPLPLQVTILVNCVWSNMTAGLSEVLMALSGNRYSILSRPVVYWVIISPTSNHLGSLEILLKGPDTIISVSPYQNITQMTKNTKSEKICEKYFIINQATQAAGTIQLKQHSISGSMVNLPSLPSVKFSGFNRAEIRIGTSAYYAPFSYISEKDGSTTGIALEVVLTLATKFNFRVKYVYAPKGIFGSRYTNGSWNGMIAQMLAEEIDVIADGFTITPSRSTVVDFTVPYWYEWLSGLIYLEDETWFSFVAPLRTEVWITYALMALLMSAIISLISCWANGEWTQTQSNRHKLYCTGEYSTYLLSCIGYICFQGGNIQFQRGPERFIVAFMWMTILIIAATYSGNLIASLSTQRVKLPLSSIEDLANSQDYLPALSHGSGLIDIIKEGKGTTYKKLWQKISANPQVIMEPMASQTDFIRSGKYVKIGDYMTARKWTVKQTSCKFYILPERFQPTAFGIALPKGSPFNELFSKVISQILEAGLDLRWIVKHLSPDPCEENLKTSVETQPVSLLHISGLFLIVTCGTGLGFLILLCEKLVWNSYNQCGKDK